MERLVQKQKDLWNKLDKLCEKPVAKSLEEVECWQNDFEKYLKIKSSLVSPLPSGLDRDVRELIEESQMYYHLIEAWYEGGPLRFNKMKLFQKHEKGEISLDEYRTSSRKIKKDFTSDHIQDKVDTFFSVFQEILEAIKVGSEWFDLYKASHLNFIGDVVWSISAIEIFAWQLPSSDPNQKEKYWELSKIMAICKIVDSIHSSNNTKDPIKQRGLEKIVSLYNFSNG